MNSDYPGKRVLDLLGAGAACAMFAPLAATIALVTVMEDGGPAFFIQTRLGEGRRPFEIIKFRSMRDGQVTRVGRWLRRTGLDELPQFINVYRGDMSIVGPRPLTVEDVVRLGWDGPAHDWRFEPRPGITGLSQLLAGRGAARSLRLDRLYQARQGAALDLQLVALSFCVNLLGKKRIRRLLGGR